MFEITQQAVASDLPTIVGEYEVLHYDEVPILFAGYNRYGNRIVGSIADIDEDAQIERYFYSLVDSAQYAGLLARKISYRDIVEGTKWLFVVDREFGGKHHSTYLVSISDIPEEFLPAADAFLPLPRATTVAKELVVSLHGGLAERHRGRARAISRLQVAWSRVIEAPFRLFDSMRGVEVLVEPSTAGSYRLNFEVSVSDVQLTLIPSTSYQEFAAAFLEYCISTLPYDLQSDDQAWDQSSSYIELQRKWKALLRASGEQREDSDYHLHEALAASANALEDAADVLGRGFDQMYVTARDSDSERPIGRVDTKFAIAVGAAADILQARVYEVKVDAQPRDYDIVIYNLNSETRKGHARVYGLPRKRRAVRSRIRIIGQLPLTDSQFTDSLHKDRLITVKAVGRYQQDRLVRLDVIDERSVREPVVDGDSREESRMQPG